MLGKRMRTTLKPATPSAPSHSSLPKKLTREELRDKSVKGLCWHCNKLWSRNHYRKKGELSMMKSIKEYEEEVQEPEEENMKEDSQPTDCTTHALAGHANPQATKVEESFKQQPITVLINNLMNGKGEQVTLCEKYGSEVMTISAQRRYYRFHKEYVHDTEECRDLKNQIEDLIRQRHLDRYVRDHKTTPEGRHDKNHWHPPMELVEK
ncbi:hypothetical protein B296_00021608 [Ensete ventricosum]|uniref:Uncharacterized protein n=1 Tax=Ensete ventricosum TaxID=4639 RepID=A0A426Y737_ENSVE|nr:hypothetical protein B296_00021608 [Ensete ventricosum]